MPSLLTSPQGPTQGQVRSFMRRHRGLSTMRSKQELVERSPAYTHWDYENWREIWAGIRHAMIGEVEIKRHGHRYLPMPDGMDEFQYDAYLDRAVFYNMVYRTVTGLTGAIFRRDPRVINSTPRLDAIKKSISKDGLSINIFTKVIAQEMLSIGRYGVLVDMTPDLDAAKVPYLCGYTAENILDWGTRVINGRDELEYVLLREMETDRRLYVPEGNGVVANKHYGDLYINYRILRLVWDEDRGDYVYQQDFYSNPGIDADLTDEPKTFTPAILGVPFNRIPFKIFNATTNRPDCEKPPILDILTLNLSHYKSYAQLEHGRFYTANPIYTVTGASEQDEYHIGPSVVWEIQSGEKASILEYNGVGLKHLESALVTKETQVASLGGRLLGDSKTAGQSDNQVRIKDRNEQSLLLNVTTVLNENMTYLLGICARWMNENPEELEFRVNQDFLLENMAAREFRAITMMYQAGILPIEVLYEYFLKADVIPEYISLERFRSMLDDASQFPNDPNFEARRLGFADARQEKADELERDSWEFEADEKEKDREAAERQRESDREDREAMERQRRQNEDDEIPRVPAQARAAQQRDNPPPPRGR